MLKWSNVTSSTTGTSTSGATVVTVASTSGIAIGNTVSASGINSGTTVSAIGTGTVTLSAATTAALSSTAIKFANWNTYKGIQAYNGTAWTAGKSGHVFDGSIWKMFYPEVPANSTVPAMSGYNILYSSTRPYVEYPAQISVTNGTWSGSPTQYEYTFQESPWPNPSFSWSTISGPSTSVNSLNISGKQSGKFYQALVKATNARGSTEVTASGSTVQAPSYVPNFSFSNDSSTGLTTMYWSGAFDIGPSGYGGQGYHLYYYYVNVVPTYDSYTTASSETFNYLSYQNAYANFTLMGVYIASYRDVAGYPGPNGTNHMSGFYNGDLILFFPPYAPTNISNGFTSGAPAGYWYYSPSWTAGAYASQIENNGATPVTYTVEVYGSTSSQALGGTLYGTYTQSSGTQLTLPAAGNGGYTYYSVRVKANSSVGSSQWSAYAPAT